MRLPGGFKPTFFWSAGFWSRLLEPTPSPPEAEGWNHNVHVHLSRCAVASRRLKGRVAGDSDASSQPEPIRGAADVLGLRESARARDAGIGYTHRLMLVPYLLLVLHSALLLGQQRRDGLPAEGQHYQVDATPQKIADQGYPDDPGAEEDCKWETPQDPENPQSRPDGGVCPGLPTDKGEDSGVCLPFPRGNDNAAAQVLAIHHPNGQLPDWARPDRRGTGRTRQGEHTSRRAATLARQHCRAQMREKRPRTRRTG
eukprot:gene1510-biopygen13882